MFDPFEEMLGLAFPSIGEGSVPLGVVGICLN